MSMDKSLKVLFAAFEAVPFMKTGGLGDVGGSLPWTLKDAGVDVRLIMPKFETIPEEYKSRMTHVTEFNVPLGWRNQYCGIEKLIHKGVTCYFIDNEYYYKRDRAYGYMDDSERIAFFSKAVVESISHLEDFRCQVLHCHDWHTALAPVYLREMYMEVEECKNVKTVFTVHNLKFQGQYSDYILGDVLGLHDIPAAADQLRYKDGTVNYMKGALCYSDALTTVSPSYAEEIKTDFFGEGLNDIFLRRESVLSGILNGIDTKEYDPSSDANISANYTSEDLSSKAQCKKALRQELGLDEADNVPIICMIGRLTDQKGLDIVLRIFDELLTEPVQIAILGTGDKKYEDAFKYYAWKYKGKLSVSLKFDEKLSHRMYAGSDMLLMPSLFEPCGLSQMIAMLCGTLPVVRETGGLRDSVVPYNKYTGEGTGFSFANFNAHEMLFTLKDAIALYRDDKDAWLQLMKQAMAADFSWDAAALKYIDIYRQLCPEEKAEKKPARKTKTTSEKAKTPTNKSPAKSKAKTEEKKA